MKKVLTLGFATLAIFAMLFSGIAAAQLTGSTTSTPNAGGATSTQAAGSAGSAGIVNSAGSAGSAGIVNSAGSAGSAGYTTLSGTSSASITGIMPVGKENVQITNLGDSSVSLAGFSLTMQDGTEFSLPSTQLNSGDFVNVFFGTGTNSDSSTYLNSMKNNVLDDVYGSVTLTNNNGDKVSTLSYENTFSSLNNSPGSTTVSNPPGGATVSSSPGSATVNNPPGASTAGSTSNSK